MFNLLKYISIYMDELTDTIKGCESNKSPGLDGISYELYQQMWHIIGNDLLEVLNCQLKRKGLIESNNWLLLDWLPKWMGFQQLMS